MLKYLKLFSKNIKKSLDNLRKNGILNVAFMKITVPTRRFYQRQSGHQKAISIPQASEDIEVKNGYNNGDEIIYTNFVSIQEKQEIVTKK